MSASPRAARASTERQAPAPPPGIEAVQPLLHAYLQDPAAHRRELIRTLFPHRRALPPPLKLMLADALLGARRPRAAHGLLAGLVGEDADPGTAGAARLALGWTALAAGDTEAGTAAFKRLADDGPHRLLATTVLGLIEASEGREDPAVRLLNAIRSSEDASPALKSVAHIGIAYAYYWGGDYPTAAAYFDEVPRFHPQSPLVDDARYGKAWAQHRAGNVVEGRAGLMALATEVPAGAATSPALIDLPPEAVFRERMRRYVGATSIAADELLVRMLDLDGHALAVAALRLSDPEARPSVSTVTSAALATAPAGTGAILPRPAGETRTPEQPAHSPRAWSWWYLVAAAAALAVAAVVRRRR